MKIFDQIKGFLYLLQALRFQKQGALKKAAYYFEYLEQHSRNPQRYSAFLKTLILQKKYYSQALTLSMAGRETSNPSVNAFFNLGVKFFHDQKYTQALENFEIVRVLEKKDAEVYKVIGRTYHELGMLELASKHYAQSRQLNSVDHETLTLLGIISHEKKEFRQAIDYFQRALKLNNQSSEAFYNKGLSLTALHSFSEAINSFSTAIELNKNDAAAYNSRGINWHKLNNYNRAKQDYEAAIKLDSKFTKAIVNKGILLQDIGQLELALSCYKSALKDCPNYPSLYAMYIHLKSMLCDWATYYADLKKLKYEVITLKKVAQPFFILPIIDSAEIQLLTSKNWVNNYYPAMLDNVMLEKIRPTEKIRIAYFSADFRTHAVSILIQEIFELHDRSKFEIFAISLSAATKDPIQNSIRGAVDHFVDAAFLTDAEISAKARGFGIHFAVDLGGYTLNSRPGIFAHRAAPIQISYLGYLSTSGAKYIDYLLADRILINNTNRKFFSESIVYLPSYQANNSKRPRHHLAPVPDELSLTKKHFSFCCFNNNFKITPDIFDSWMRILSQVENSVMYLYADNLTTRNNLIQEAALRKVNADRLIFTSRLELSQYTRLYQYVDLFLDTFPYTSGTIASDALWAGVPLITRSGDTFASRMAASVLEAIGMPELVTYSSIEYERLAVDLAQDKQKLKALREKIQHNRCTTLLFDSIKFTRSLETAYIEMLQKKVNGLPTTDLTINPSL